MSETGEIDDDLSFGWSERCILCTENERAREQERKKEKGSVYKNGAFNV